MKKILSSIVFAATACAPLAAHATTIDFNLGLDPFFNYSGVLTSTFSVASSGYANMQAHTGSLGFAYNPNEASPSTFTAAGKFDLNSFLIDGAWGTQTLTIAGLLNGVTMYTKLVGVNLDPQLVMLNWSGIDEFVISTGNDFVESPSLTNFGSGRHWVLDDVVVDQSRAAIPEPGNIALFSVGLAGLVGMRRRRKS